MSQAIIQSETISRYFKDKKAVDGLNLEIQQGEIFGLLGHNGAGKTTTIRLLNGVLTPTNGTMRVLGYDPTVDGAALRQRTGVLTETPSLDERLTARMSLQIFAELYNVPAQRCAERVDAVLRQFGLIERADERVGGYSKGMRQRLAIARTLLHEPELIFLDEPTSGLDPAAIREVQQLIIRLSRTEGRTIILCTHNLVEAERLCDRVAVLAQGKLLAVGSPAQLQAQYSHTTRLQIETDPDLIDKTSLLLQDFTAINPITIEKQTERNVAGHLTLQGIARPHIPALITYLSNAKIPLYRVTPEEASLEDVYFAMQKE